MRVLREGPHARDAWLRHRIGFVDDAKRSFAPRDQEKRGTDIFGLSDAALDRLPNAEGLERCPAVLTSRDRVRVGHREAPLSEKRQQGELGHDGNGAMAPCRRSENEESGDTHVTE